MHAITSITSRITIGGAGRRHKHLVQDTDKPLASQSSVQEPDPDARRCGRKEKSLAVAVVSQWKGRIARIAKKISSSLSREKLSSAEAERMKKLLHDAVRAIAYLDDNERARLELKASVAAVCTSEDFDKLFPPSLRYVGMDWEEEYAEKASVELVSARK